jgi:hypothetical protein
LARIRRKDIRETQEHKSVVILNPTTDRKFFWATMITLQFPSNVEDYLFPNKVRIFKAIARDQFYAVSE